MRNPTEHNIDYLIMKLSLCGFFNFSDRKEIKRKIKEQKKLSDDLAKEKTNKMDMAWLTTIEDLEIALRSCGLFEFRERYRIQKSIWHYEKLLYKNV